MNNTSIFLNGIYSKIMISCCCDWDYVSKNRLISFLEETMNNAYREINEIRKQFMIDMRTAAYVSAINKVATSYELLGIFP
jgi:glutamate dehydrogenase/leucine dehydrogenase